MEKKAQIAAAPPLNNAVVTRGEIGSMITAIDELSNTVLDEAYMLADRLSPILRAQPEKDVPSDDTKPTTAAGEQLAYIIRRLELARSFIRDTNGRVEL